MALPFLKNKDRQVAGIAVEYRKPDTRPDDADSSSEALEACARDILRAVAQSDSKALAGALRSAFDVCSSLPEPEGPEMNPDAGDQE